MGKQNVLIVHNYYQIPGGEDTVVENEKKMLIENGHKVILYTRHNDEIKSNNILKKFLLPFETIFSLKTYKDIKRIIREEKIEIVHVHNTLPLISPSVYYAARSCKIPAIQTLHNFRLLCPAATFVRNDKICEKCLEKSLFSAVKYKCYRNSFLQSSIISMNIAIHRFIGTYKRINGYIALTEFNKKKFENLIDSKKIFIKPNFSNFNDDKSLKLDNRRYFLYLGRVDKIKGLEVILRAWKNIKEEELYIVGTGPYEENVKEYVAKNNMSNVKLLGFKRKDEVIAIIKNAKAIIIASQWYEGFPMTIVESFSLGVPVIAGDIGNMSSIIEHSANGLLFKYNDHEELRKQVEVFSNGNIMRKLSIGAKESFDKKYCKEINYNILLKVYNDVGAINGEM